MACIWNKRKRVQLICNETVAVTKEYNITLTLTNRQSYTSSEQSSTNDFVTLCDFLRHGLVTLAFMRVKFFYFEWFRLNCYM